MARNRTLVLEAVDSRVLDGEDRLTEIFAAVLRGAPELLETVLQRVRRESVGRFELEAPPLPAAHACIVRTQFMLDGGGRPDMVIEWADADRRRRKMIFEHKITAPLTLHEKTRYPTVAAGGGYRPVLVAPVGWSDSDLPEEYVRIDWRDLALDAHKIGRRRLGPGWRTVPAGPDLPSDLHLLNELIGYIERKGVDKPMTERMGSVEIATFSTAHRAVEAAEELLREVSSMVDDDLGRTEISKPERVEGVRRFVNREHAWPAAGDDCRVLLELSLGTTDCWRPFDRQRDEPALAYGYTFCGGSRYEVPWPEDLQPNGVLSLDPPFWWWGLSGLRVEMTS